MLLSRRDWRLGNCWKSLQQILCCDRWEWISVDHRFKIWTISSATMSIGTNGLIKTAFQLYRRLSAAFKSPIVFQSLQHGEGKQTSAVSGHAHNTRHRPLWIKVKFIDSDAHFYTRRVKKVIPIRLHTHNINSDSGIEIPEGWMLTIEKHDSRRLVQQRTAKGTWYEDAPIKLWNTIQSNLSAAAYKIVWFSQLSG